MKSWLVALPCCLLLLGCGVNRDIGERFRAERDLTRANEQYRDASIRRDLIGDADWRALALRYGEIADRYGTPSGDPEPDSVQTEIETVAAAALFAAARIYSSIQDSTQVFQVFSRLEQQFGHLSTVTGEVALARAEIASSRRDTVSAIRYYQTVVDRVEPDPEKTSAAGVVLDLPLRIARMKASRDTEPSREYYDEARAYYADQIVRHPGTLIQIDSRMHLADIAADLGDWRSATRSFRQVESEVLSRDPPPRDPAQIRYLIAGSLSRGGAPEDSVRQVLDSVLVDYPRSGAAVQARGALADLAMAHGHVDDAIAQMDSLRVDYAGNDEVCSQALLRKARLLAQTDGRWNEALQTFRTIIAGYPVMDAAFQAPLEIARHYQRTGDTSQMQTALAQAEQGYRDFIRRYPPGPTSLAARDHLVQTLMLQKKYDEAVKEMLQLGEDVSRTPRGPQLFVTAAKVAFSQMADTSRAVSILEHAGDIYANAKIGKWATGEAKRLQELQRQ